jgi:hypothetical protein
MNEPSMRCPFRFLAVVAVLLLVAGSVAPPAHAQLVAPGKLSEPHAEFEGIRRCTECHQLRERGIANDRCLACHTDLRTRIADSSGYHAALANRNCGECHKDHFGRDFALVRLDTASFDHDETGFTLEASHDTLSCRTCHVANLVRAADVRALKDAPGALDRTFLGLGTTCESCHADDSPHGRQFVGQACNECHEQNAWDNVPSFDHDSTRYPLTGGHRDVKCGDCHRTGTGGQGGEARYAGLRFDACTACHRDPHAGRMGTECESCHRTEGWAQIPRNRFEQDFDHGTTGYALQGRHAAIACAACHSRTQVPDGIRLQFDASSRLDAYPRPRRDRCAQCHVDRHRGVFARTAERGACDACHTVDAWGPTTFDTARHNAGGTFVLVGAHLTAECSSCHGGSATGQPERFRMEHGTCQVCHTDDDPHEAQFAGRACDECHTADAWVPTTFDLARHNADATFALEGAHLAVPCSACHDGSVTGLPARFRIDSETCRACHATDDPHGDQFVGRACEDCHTTDTFRVDRFPHDATRYPLDGRHRDVPCTGCHTLEARTDGRMMRRYKPLGTGCEDCHGGQQR